MMRRRPTSLPVGLAFDEHQGTWDEALASSSGWSSEQILNTVLGASLKVRDGEAVAERDGSVLDQDEYAWPVIAAVLWQASRDGGEARVLDFGGSFGSSYRQCQRFAAGLQRLRWAVVEQPAFVEAGHKHFANEELSFHESISDASVRVSPNTILCSGTLNYLSDPAETIQSFSRSSASTLIIDRIAVHDGDKDIVAVQRVGGTPYAAEFPMRIFSRARLEQGLSSGWDVISQFRALDGKMKTSTGRRFVWIGMVLEKRSNAGRSSANRPATS